MKKTSSLILATLAVSFILPSIALAAWWNPFTWNIWKFFPQFNKPVKTEVIKVDTNKNDQVATTTDSKVPATTSSLTTKKEIVAVSTSTNINNNGLKTFTYTDNAFSFNYPSKYSVSVIDGGGIKIVSAQNPVEIVSVIYFNSNPNLISSLAKNSIKVEFNNTTKNGYKYAILPPSAYSLGTQYLISLDDSDNPTTFLSASIYPNTIGFSQEELDTIANSLIIDKVKVIKVAQDILAIAQKKGEDAAIKASFANMRAQGELYYDLHQQTYATGSLSLNNGLCADDKDGIKKMLTNVNTYTDPVKCYASSTAWIVFGPLKTTPDIMACVDSTMYMGTTTSKNIAITGKCK